MSARRIAQLSVRVVLPAALAIAGVILIIVGHAKTNAAGAGVVILGVALMVVLLDWLARLSISSGDDRDREEQARRYLDRTGHWPGEGPS
ncbi:MAG: hypothetical protein ACLP01_23485 [Solirubrobacteraceae bacterium]